MHFISRLDTFVYTTHLSHGEIALCIINKDGEEKSPFFPAIQAFPRFSSWRRSWFAFNHPTHTRNLRLPWKYSLASSSIRLPSPPPAPPPRGEIHEKRRLAENMKLLPSGVMYGFVVSERNSVCVLAYRKGNSVTRLQRGYYIGARQEAFRKKSKHRSWERHTRTTSFYIRA